MSLQSLVDDTQERLEQSQRDNEQLLELVTKAQDRAKAEKAGGIDRYRSIAELTYLMVRLTRLNLLYCEAYCREVAPLQLAKPKRELSPPERNFVPEGYRVTGLGRRVAAAEARRLESQLGAARAHGLLGSA